MKSPIFTGAGVAIVTPFKKDYSIDYEQFEKNIEFQIANKTDAIIVTGTTGESATLVYEEHRAIVDFASDIIKHRVPLIAGGGSNSTANSIRLSIGAKAGGADALLVVTPFYNKTSQDGIVRHFEMLADAVDLPLIAYNVPSRTGLNILPETYKRLAEIPSVVGIKEANGNVASIAETIALCGDKVAVYSGNDDMVVPTLSLGGKGVISVLSNILPREVHDMCELYFSGKVKESAEMQIKYIKLIKALFSDVSPMPVKYAMELLGMNLSVSRPPLFEASEESKQKIKIALQELNIIKSRS